MEVLENKVDEILKLSKNTNKVISRESSADLIEALRHQLSSIDLIDVKTREMTPTQRRSYLQKIATFYPKGIEQDIKELIAEQLIFMGQHSQNIEQFWFARGTINGLFLLMEKYERLFLEYQELVKPKSKIDNTKLFETE